MPKKRKKKVPIPRGIVFHPSYGPNRKPGAPIPAPTPEEDVSLPEIPLKLKSSSSVKAAPRKLKQIFSMEAADELRDLWGGKRRRYIDVVERLTALDKGLPDPGEWEETPEGELVEKMAAEMSNEIDKEIKKTVGCPWQAPRAAECRPAP